MASYHELLPDRDRYLSNRHIFIHPLNNRAKMSYFGTET